LTSERISYGRRLSQLAEERPKDEYALVFAPKAGTEIALTWLDLDARSNQMARALRRSGVDPGDRVGIKLKNSPEAIIGAFAAWKAGAVPIPIRWDLPAWEMSRLAPVIDVSLILDSGSGVLDDYRTELSDRVEDVTAPHAYGICSAGSTGTPKVIIRRVPAEYEPGRSALKFAGPATGREDTRLVLTSAPIYHSMGFMMTENLLDGQRAILMERFDAEQFIDLVETHRVTHFVAASTMLQRIAQVPGASGRDFSSIQGVSHSAAPLPPWVARFWIDIVGAERIRLLYSSTERAGVISCTGTEWLAHPGTLGKGFAGTEVRILSAEGRQLGAGEVGEIYLRQPGGVTHEYLGDVPAIPTTDDGFVTLGDLGWSDDDGYVYLADRRVDIIVTGGANVYPAEVEAALSEHPDIADVVVIGLSDESWGRRVHAIVAPADRNKIPSAAAVIDFAKARLAGYKAPKSVEFLERIPRAETTKVNRGALIAEREDPGSRPE
jgi:bile acid-coenzyme A ligase